MFVEALTFHSHLDANAASFCNSLRSLHSFDWRQRHRGRSLSPTSAFPSPLPFLSHRRPFFVFTFFSFVAGVSSGVFGCQEFHIPAFISETSLDSFPLFQLRELRANVLLSAPEVEREENESPPFCLHRAEWRSREGFSILSPFLSLYAHADERTHTRI